MASYSTTDWKFYKTKGNKRSNFKNSFDFDELRGNAVSEALLSTLAKHDVFRTKDEIDIVNQPIGSTTGDINSVKNFEYESGNIYCGLLNRLNTLSQRSEETVRQSDSYDDLVKHLQGVTTNFCNFVQSISPDCSKERSFVIPLDPTNLRLLFYGDVYEFALTERLDVSIKDSVSKKKRIFKRE